MTVKRLLALCTSSALLLLPLSACSVLRKEPKPEEIHIQSQFYENKELPSVQSLADAVQRFNESHPDIHVTIDYASNMTGYLSPDEIDARLQSDLAPDIVSYSPGARLEAAASRGLLKEMSNMEGIRELGIPRNVLDSATVNGKLMMIPTEIFPPIVWVNKTRIEEAGASFPVDDWTWEQLSRLSDIANLKQTPTLPYEIQSVAYMLASVGKQPLSPDGRTAIGYLDSPEAIKAVQLLNRHYRDIEATRPIDDTAAHEHFNRSDTVFYLSNLSADFPKLAGSRRDMLDFAFLPHFEGLPQIRTIGIGGYAISARSKSPEAAWKVIRYLAFGSEGDTSDIGITNVPTASLFADRVKQYWGDNANRLLALLSDATWLPADTSLLDQAMNGVIKIQFESLLAIGDEQLPSAMHGLALAVDEELARLRTRQIQ